MPKGRILVVDDHVALAENISEILIEAGYAADFVVSAEQALEQLKQAEYRGVITDFRLPGCTGVELVLKLRSAGHTLPVVMVSAFVEPGVIERAEAAGALDVLPKPIDIPRLFALVEQFGRDGRSVLVVDDNRELAENIAEGLRGAGAEVTVEYSAAAALSSRVLPRLAVIDVRLPDLSGVEVARRLHARDPEVQLVFMTGHAEDVPQVIEGLRPGPDGALPPPEVLTKPVDVQTLIVRVGKAMGT